jgi:ATP-dependent helicase HrpB
VRLPIDDYIPEVIDRLRTSRALVLTAQPGAGKTTRVPPALVGEGPVVVLQPRRVAARAIARRIAEERGWTLGDEVGWQVRFERRFSGRTRLLVATEGVLTARLQRDPLLSEFRTIVLDEFHERSIHADLAIALAKQAWRARDDLRIVVMSATLDAGAVAEYLDGCPTIDVPGRVHPLDLSYAPGQSVADAAADLVAATAGHVLCFLPGAREIRQAVRDLERDPRLRGLEIVPLHGSLESSAQDAALHASAPSVRRIVVATNIAETSVTVPGVMAVVDSGVHKVARYDAERAIDSLDLERISQDSADQRAGRAGREGPGVVRRLWNARDRLRPHRQPEIGRVDLSATVLDVIAWGGDPYRLDWFERPRDGRVAAAVALLDRIGATRHGTLTEIGERIRSMPLHPRLSRMIVASGGMRAVARACALLSERHFIPPRTATTTSDLLSAIDDWANVPPHVQRAAQEIEEIAARTLVDERQRQRGKELSEAEFRRAILAGYPDRVAQRREPGSARVRLASGAGASIGSESGVREGEFLVALDVSAENGVGSRFSRPAGKTIADPVSEARIRVASRVEPEWLEPNASEIVHRFDAAAGVVRASKVERYDALVIAERPVKSDPDAAARLLADAWLARGPNDADERLLRRLNFAGRSIDVNDVVARAARDARSLSDLHLADAVAPEVLRAIDREAPDAITVPSGRRVTLDYGADGGVSASVKLQELFGLAETPRVGPRREPVLLSLLAPNGRPVQLTRDLRSFWDRTYPEVRKELRGRYPKHPWPEDPWAAKPTARTKRRS